MMFLPLSALWFLAVIVPCWKLRNVFFDYQVVRITDGMRVVNEVPIENVVSIDRVFYFFYRLVVLKDNGTQSYLVLPKIEEAMMTLGLSDGASIKGFRRLLKP